jgi:hypothetical protein
MTFVTNPNRDASAIIGGFVFQVNVTILRWLNLRDDEVIELERGEDIDVLQTEAQEGIDPARLVEQVKVRSAALTLRSPEALSALANFCEHKRSNPHLDIKFRYLTTAAIAIERGWPFDESAIVMWKAFRDESLQEGQRKPFLAITAALLQACKRPSGVRAMTWGALQSIVTEPSGVLLGELISSFEWSTGEGQEDVELKLLRALIDFGHASDLNEARTHLEQLFFYVFKKLTERGLKRLTKNELYGESVRTTASPAEAALVAAVNELRLLSKRIDGLTAEVGRHDQLLATLDSQVKTLAKEVGATIDYRRWAVTLDAPEPVEPGISRDEVVEDFAKGLRAYFWTALVGEPGSGKTQLCFRTVQYSGLDGVWVQLRGKNADQAAEIIDAGLSVASSISPSPFRRPWFESVLKKLGSSSVIIVEDVPRVLVGSDLALRLQYLHAACTVTGARMITTSYFDLPNGLSSNPQGIHECFAPPFSNVEISALFRVFGAPDDFSTPKLLDILQTATRGLPVLVAAAARFLRTHRWTRDLTALSGILQGQFASSVKQDAKALLPLTVPDAQTRELLYRLTLTIGPFSKDEIDAIAEVNPGVLLAREKSEDLVGLWIQRYSNDQYLLSPLVDVSWGDYLATATKRTIHTKLGMILLRRRILGSVDVLACMHHFISAGDFDLAAVVLLQALRSIVESGITVKDEWELLAIWGRESLPASIDINLRLQLRAAQIIAMDASNKDFSFFAADLDSLLATAGDEASVGVLISTASLALKLHSRHPIATNTWVLRALQHTTGQVILPNGAPFVIPDEAWLESFFWMTAISLRSNRELGLWSEAIIQLSPLQIQRLMKSDLAHDGATLACDAVWLREMEKQKSDQQWAEVGHLLELTEERSSAIGLTLLSASARRTRIMLVAEQLGMVEQAVVIANEGLEATASTDYDSIFLILEVTGRQLVYNERWSEGARWIERALAVQCVKPFALLRRNLWITLSKAVGLVNLQEAVACTQQGVQECVQLPPLRMAESYGEHAIALWRAGSRKESFEAWRYGVTILMEAKSDDPAWRSMFIAYLHASGYFASMSLFGSPPTSGYTIPEPLFFLASGSSRTGYLTVQEPLLFLRTAMFAEGLGAAAICYEWAKMADRPDARDIELLKILNWLPIAHLVLTDDYLAALEVAKSIATIDERRLATGFGSTDNEQRSAVVAPQSPKHKASHALLLGLTPVAFRLARRLLEEDVAESVRSVASYLSAIDDKDLEEWRDAAPLLSDTFAVDGSSWKDLHNQGSQLVERGSIAPALISFLGSCLKAPLKQSVVTQIWVARYVQKLFPVQRSIRNSVLLPFYERFWDVAIERQPEVFRTSPQFTRRRLEQALSCEPDDRPKSLLNAMVFCLGVTPPDDLDAWLQS